MTKRMLIDATHAEETRVVVLDGNRLEDFDVETSTKRQLKGNIYLAKVVRVEPSLQAAFVEYGGGRHGFLAFGEIHPDYYQIPVADRQRLLALQAEEAREEAEAEEAAAAAAEMGHHQPRRQHQPQTSRRHEAQPGYDEAAQQGYDEAAQADEPAYDDAAPDVFAETGDFAEDNEQAAAPGNDDLPAAPPATDVADDGAADAPADAPISLASPVALDLIAEPVPEAAAEAEPAVAGSLEQPVPPDNFVAPVDSPEAIETIAPSPIADTVSEGPEAERDGPAMPAMMAREERYGSSGDTGQDEFDAPESDAPPPETIGGDSENSDSGDDARARRTFRFLRNYRIQEVIKRRQILLVQVVKEERGTKGAALTTYISLAGRFCVLMPNSPRGGGISRKITSASDRKRLKEIMAELEIPTGMGLIVRTAGANRPKPEIKRDCEYLMRLWDDVRDHTMRSVAPALIYEEASLIKRAIRDVYSRDVDEVIVDGEEGWKAARDFMRMLMPSHAKKVLPWRGAGGLSGGSSLPLFAKHQVEAQLDSMLVPTVQLKSGGYLVINQTEALVAIDVNSGRSTRERGIEETALRTNLEASDEVARQLRLRDLAGLIVIDFIDMEAKKHNAMVERRLKDALKNDRARIQVGHISHFGLMEMSRQRLRPSLAETSFIACPHCAGLGHVRSTESSAIHVLRGIEEEGAKARASLIMVHAAGSVVMYLLNHKRERLAEIEAAYAMKVHFTADDTLLPPNIRIDRLRPALLESERAAERALLPAPVAPAAPVFSPIDDDAVEEADDIVDSDDDDAPVAQAPARPQAQAERPAAERPAADRPQGGAAASGDESGRRRRRRRRRGRRDGVGTDSTPGSQQSQGGDQDGDEGDDGDEDQGEALAALAGAGDTGDSAPALTEDTVAEPVDLALAEQPAIDAAELDENGLPKAGARRRGRRGGRRRRRGEEGGEDAAEGSAEADAPAPAPAPAPARVVPIYTAPVYTGPTPADPFGGGAIDIFDMIDMDGDSSPPPAPPPAPPSPVVAPVPVADSAPEPVAAPLEPVVEPVVEPAVEPVAVAAPVAIALAPETPPDPVAVPQEPLVAQAPPPVADAEPPQQDAAVAGPVVGPVIQPIVLGKDELPPAERKRGWWKR